MLWVYDFVARRLEPHSRYVHHMHRLGVKDASTPMKLKNHRCLVDTLAFLDQI